MLVVCWCGSFVACGWRWVWAKSLLVGAGGCPAASVCFAPCSHLRPEPLLDDTVDGVCLYKLQERQRAARLQAALDHGTQGHDTSHPEGQHGAEGTSLPQPLAGPGSDLWRAGTLGESAPHAEEIARLIHDVEEQGKRVVLASEDRDKARQQACVSGATDMVRVVVGDANSSRLPDLAAAR